MLLSRRLPVTLFSAFAFLAPAMAACEDDTATTPTDSGLPADATTTDAGSDATNTAPDAADANASADAQSDGTTAADAGSDSGPLDAQVDAQADASAPSVVAGADGILRGVVRGMVTQDWSGRLAMPDASCPPGAQQVPAGPINCCVFGGGAPTSAAGVAVTFDPATRTGTLAGAPFGPLNAAVVGADGTQTYKMAAFLEAKRAWQIGIEVVRPTASVPTIAQMTRMLANPALVNPTSDSARNFVVAWNPQTAAFRVGIDLSSFAPTATGTCGNGTSTARIQFTLQ